MRSCGKVVNMGEAGARCAVREGRRSKEQGSQGQKVGRKGWI